MFAMNQALSGLLTSVSFVLAQHNCRAYVVGGFVRDRLMERETDDIDFAVDGDSLGIAQEVAKAVNGCYVLLNEANKVARVIVDTDDKPYYLDFTSFGGFIDDDLARRDFTIDAMSVELRDLLAGSAQLIDPFAGKSDLEMKLVRAVNHGIFEADAARLLRAVRLAADLCFKIEPETEKLLRQSCYLVAQVSGERLREELLRLLALFDYADWMRYLDSVGLLTAIIPELNVMKGVEQPKEHYWSVLDHSMETMATVGFMLRESEWKYVSRDVLSKTLWSSEIQKHFGEAVSSGSNRGQLLKLAGLLHDIAKPLTKTVEKTGRVRFLGHAKEGAAISARILHRLRFSGKEIRLVESLVYHHLRPAQMANEGLPTSRAIYRFFRDTEDAGLDVLFLALADYLATHGPKLDVGEWQQHNQLIIYIYNEYLAQQTKTLPAKLIDGHDIISILGLSPGPVIGELLAEVREAQVAGEVNTREDAIALVRKIVANRHCETAC